MLNPIIARDGERFAHDPSRRSLQGLFQSDAVNRCPGCGRSVWVIGRFSAECGFCATTLPLSHTDMLGAGTYRRGGSGMAEAWGDVS